MGGDGRVGEMARADLGIEILDAEVAAQMRLRGEAPIRGEGSKGQGSKGQASILLMASRMGSSLQPTARAAGNGGGGSWSRKGTLRMPGDDGGLMAADGIAAGGLGAMPGAMAMRGFRPGHGPSSRS